MKTTLAVVLVAAGFLLAARPTVAHHAFSAEFDANTPVNLTGTVTKVEWTNPHAWFYIDVADATGKVTNWALELGGPNTSGRDEGSPRDAHLRQLQIHEDEVGTRLSRGHTHAEV